MSTSITNEDLIREATKWHTFTTLQFHTKPSRQLCQAAWFDICETILQRIAREDGLHLDTIKNGKVFI